MSRYSVGISFLLVVLSSGPSVAQVSVSPYAGLMIYDGSLMIYEGDVYKGSGIENGSPVPVVGLRFGYEIASHWTAELSYGRSWLKNGRGDLAAHQYNGTLQYSFVRSAIWGAHLAVGGGAIDFRPSSTNLNSLSDPTITGGFGVSYRVRPRLEVRTDLRFIGQFCSQKGERSGLVCNDGSQLGYSELSAGLRFRL